MPEGLDWLLNMALADLCLLANMSPTIFLYFAFKFQVFNVFFSPEPNIHFNELTEFPLYVHIFLYASNCVSHYIELYNLQLLPTANN